MDSLARDGLSKAEAERRLASVGPNALPASASRGLFRIIFETMREPMFLLLIGASALYLVLGDLGEGLFLMAGALATIGLVVLQEARSEKALAALRDLSQPRARVIRDKVERSVAARELVPGDIVLVGEGERLPADGVLTAGDVLSVDESALTGESAPICKRPLLPDEAADPDAPPGADSGPNLYSGTLIVRGQAVAVVNRTGPRTALGKIGLSLAAITQEPTPLQKIAGRLVTWLGAFALTLLRHCRDRLRTAAGRLGKWRAGRDYPRHRSDPRRIPHGAGGVPGAWGLALGDPAGSGSAQRRHRSAGRRDCALRRQDRNPDRESDAGRPALDRRRG
jgi:magnesium-transporting ATPase (P-type)